MLVLHVKQAMVPLHLKYSGLLMEHYILGLILKLKEMTATRCLRP